MFARDPTISRSLRSLEMTSGRSDNRITQASFDKKKGKLIGLPEMK
jgi:hypothetical protein